MAVKKAVYFFCMDSEKDEVAPLVFEKSSEILKLSETGMEVDAYPVLEYKDGDGNIIYYVRTSTVICMDYGRYLPEIKEKFSDCDLAVMVNWHGGGNAPDKVICIHTVGDVSSGVFGKSEPVMSTNLARALERHRQVLELDDFKVTTEATHWSGVVYGGKVEWIDEYKVPFLDVEIGSTSESYNNPAAVEVIARALIEVFGESAEYPTILYMGGIHFEDTITNAVLHPTHPVSLTHILPSRWLENEMYTGEAGISHLMDCINSINGGVQGIVIHEKLGREQRELAAALSERLGVPLVKRKALKAPKSTEFYAGR